MDEKAKERLGDAVDEMQERGKEAMKQHGDLGGTVNLEDPESVESPDPLEADPDEVERAIEQLRDLAVERAREEHETTDQEHEVVGE